MIEVASIHFSCPINKMTPTVAHRNPRTANAQTVPSLWFGAIRWPTKRGTKPKIIPSVVRNQIAVKSLEGMTALKIREYEA